MIIDNNLLIQVLATIWFCWKGIERLALWWKDKHDKQEDKDKDRLTERINKIEDEMQTMQLELAKKISHKEIKDIQDKLYEIHGQVKGLIESLKVNR